MQKLKEFFGKNKKIITGVIIFIVVFSATFAAYRRYKPNTEKGEQNTNIGNIFSQKQTEKKPEKAVDKLEGILVDKGTENRHPLAVMIENHPDARPQSGLNKASIIFEALTEGGITRYMAIYGPFEAPEVGPIRSARSFFVDWAEGFDAYYTYAGQALDAGQKIAADKTMALSGYDGGQRKEYKNVASEHTLYNSTANLYKQAETKGYSKNASYTAWSYENELALEKRGNQDSISINYGGSYDVKWVYNKTSNIYNRFLDGAKHTDRTSDEQLTAKNIVIITVNRTPLQLPDAKTTYKFTTVGSGKAVVVTNGNKTEGTWKKTSSKDQIKFLNADGNEIKLTPGVTWVEVIAPEITFSIKDLPTTSSLTTAVNP